MIAPVEATSQGMRVLVAPVGIEWVVGFFGGPATQIDEHRTVG